MERLALVARFDPESREQVKTLLEAGPPFDLEGAGIDRHLVFVSSREAVFVFEGSEVEWEVEELADGFFHPELQAALSEWQELLVEEPRLAHEVFAWLRGEPAGEAGKAEVGALRVGDLVPGDHVVVAPEDTIGEAAEKLAGHGLAPALVLDFGRLIGVLAPDDVLRATVERVHPSEGRVREWMRETPASVAADASPEQAALAMLDAGVQYLPVVDGERPVGLVSLGALVGARPAAPSRG